MNLEYVIQSCKNEYKRYNKYEQKESNIELCELITTTMKNTNSI